MKKSILNSGIILLTTLLSVSCSSDSNDSSPTPSPSTQNSWKMNEYNFSRRVSTQTSTTYTNGKPFTQVIVDSNITNNNNNFKACSLDFWFNTSLVGTYTAKSKNTLVNYDELNYMNISCTVTDAAGKGAIYESIDSNTTVSITKADGKFIMNAPDGITLTKVFDDGLENAPTTMTFKCEKVR